MKQLSSYERRTFLKDHPPVMKQVLISSTGTEIELVAGTVLGRHTDKVGEYVPGSEALYILGEDITVPEAGDVYALVYIHADVVVSELVWGVGVSADEQKTAIGVLRSNGIYAN